MNWSHSNGNLYCRILGMLDLVSRDHSRLQWFWFFDDSCRQSFSGNAAGGSRADDSAVGGRSQPVVAAAGVATD